MPNDEGNPQLRVKSYFAAAVEDAMELARVELGPDALLLNSREAPPEARHLGELEVVFGTRPAAAPQRSIPDVPADPLADLRERFEALRQMVSRAIPATRRESAGGSLADALCAVEIVRPLAIEIESAVQQRLRGNDVIEIVRPARVSDGNVDMVVRETVNQLENRFQAAPELGRIAAFIGPPGAGKTTALIKLAVTQGLMRRRPVRLLSIDHCRIAAADQLRTFAAILGVPFVLAETTLALAQAIDSAPPETLILIDTPGYTAASINESGGDLAEFLRDRQDIDTHLVLTASMRHADLSRTVDLFSAFHPAKLLFTRLDETDSTASMFCEAARTGLPLSYFSTGQLIPEDLEAATKARITASLVRELPQALQAVA